MFSFPTVSVPSLISSRKRLVIAFLLAIPQYRHQRNSHDLQPPLCGLDRLAILLKLFVYVMSFTAFAYARRYIEERKIARGEYYILGLFCVIGHVRHGFSL